MSKFSSITVYNAIIEQGLVPLFYNGDFEISRNIVSAIAKSGGKIVEFTNRGNFAYKIFTKLVKHLREKEPHLILGVGSIVDPFTAALYINNGANFVVSPILNRDIAKICNRRRVPYIPGCATPTEISNAEELGCEIIKIFPANILGGPDFVKSILAPNPWIKLMPTGGVDITQESIKSWFAAGVVAVGIGSKLIPKNLVKSKNWEAITTNISNTLNIIKKIKEQT